MELDSVSLLTKVIAAAAAGVVGLVPVATPALAQQSPQHPEYAPTMLVLDASGSMRAADPGGGTKMDAAKAALRSFIGSAPAASKVGLTVYGTSTGSSDAEKAAGCRDVKVLRAADTTIDKAALTVAVDQITPRGYTPIGTALRAAAESLPQEGPRSVVLVSDGLDTCAPPDPCEVARELSAQGAEIVVHAIGFGVDDPSRAQLTCIAEATGGTYTDAVDGSALEQVLPRVSAAALRNYSATGMPIEGTPGYRDAPLAAPGQYLDALEQQKQHYYAVDVPEGATAYFSGTVSFPRGGESLSSVNRLDLRVYGANGRDCDVSEQEMATRSNDGVALTVATVWDGATQSDSGEADCAGGGRYYFALEWGHAADNAPAELPLEISVGVEAAVSDPGRVAEPTPVTFTAPDGPAVSVTGGGSFNVAAALPGSGRYADTLRRGEFVFYRVKLDWGQGLAYRVRFAETPGRGADYTSNIATTLYTPYREELDSATTAYTGVETMLPSNDPALATAPIRYLNREASDNAIAKQAVAGWYYLAVKLSPAASGDRSAGVPVEVELDIVGDPEPGPQYRSGADETFGAEGKSGGGTDGDQLNGSDGDDGTSVAVWIAGALGACVIAVGILVVIVLIRRRAKR